jgi:pullulanase/glycogen debranching enzyme
MLGADLAEIAADPWLADRVMIAEPWDIGPGGVRWRCRRTGSNGTTATATVRRFWRGCRHWIAGDADCGIIGRVRQGLPRGELPRRA